jgi:hypothetical protein
MKSTLFAASPQAVIRTPYALQRRRKGPFRALFPVVSLILEVLETLFGDD